MLSVPPEVEGNAIFDEKCQILFTDHDVRSNILFLRPHGQEKRKFDRIQETTDRPTPGGRSN